MPFSSELQGWLVVGIALHKTVAPVLRCFVEEEVTRLYNHYDNIFNLKTLQLIQVSAHPELKSLSFRNINNNHSVSNKKKYNYHIYSPLDLAKLYLAPISAKCISGFDESLDPGTSLLLLGSKVSLVTKVHDASFARIQDLADDVRENVRNEWGHYDSTKWTETFFKDCFEKLRKLVSSLGLKDGGKATLDELDEYKTKALCMGGCLDQGLLQMIQDGLSTLLTDFQNIQKHYSATQDSLVEMQDQQSSKRARLEAQDQQLSDHEEVLINLNSAYESLKTRIEEVEQKVKIQESKKTGKCQSSSSSSSSSLQDQSERDDLTSEMTSGFDDNESLGPSGLVEFTPDELNYFRLSYIAFKLIPDGLRKIFKQEWDIRYKIKLGEWKDTPKNGRDFYELESRKKRMPPGKLFMILQNGNTAEWDATSLFYSIVTSDSIGSSLSPMVKKPVDDLRLIRNDVAHFSKPSITDAEFQRCAHIVLNAFTSLGLSISDVEAVKNQGSFQTAEFKLLGMLVDNVTDKLKPQAAPSITEEHKVFSPDLYSKIQPFCSLTFKPLHQIIEHSNDIKRIMKKMEETRIGSNGLVSTIYFSGNPGCGKSQLARQIGQEFFSSRSRGGPTFVGTINAETLQTLGDSYILLAKQLGIAQRTLTILAIAVAERPKETINHLKEIILPIVRKFSAWLIIADNVVDLTMVHSYLPQTASEEWGHGQVLITTQERSSIPTRALNTYHELLSEGMLQDDAMELLKEVSHISSQDQHAEHVAKSLGHQPLALAAAALYTQAVINGGSPKYSWSDYFKSIVQGERRPLMRMVTDESSRAVVTSIKVAIDKSMKTDEILRQMFTLFSVCASDYLPIQAALNFVKDRSNQSEEKIKEHLLESSSFLSVSEEDGSPEYLRLHSTVLQVLKTEDIFGLEPEQRAKCLSAASKVFLVLLDEKQKNTSKDEREYLQLRKIKSHLSSMVTSMHTSILASVSQKVQ